MVTISVFTGYYITLGMDEKDHIFNSIDYLPVTELEKVCKYDLNKNGTCEKIILKDGVLKIYSGSLLLWSSEPENWWVDFFFPGDSDNDRVPELNMVVWKKGNFGPVKPFWVKEDNNSIKCHLFVFRLQKYELYPVWMSSNLPHPIYKAELNDITGNGKNELIITAGSYNNPGKKETMVWKWDEWGFTQVQNSNI
ncbi:MAG: hypothetical protein K9L17_01055 [Clostridiales bacterium]|nr:hypothetical protein [Clostridiales bacterium]